MFILIVGIYLSAEHVQPGESYKAAAIRGVFEELSITLDEKQQSNLTPIGSPKLSKYEEPSKNIKDYEFQQTFKLIYDGPFKIDGIEVADAKFITLEKLTEEVLSKPDKFTPWFRNVLPLGNIITQ